MQRSLNIFSGLASFCTACQDGKKSMFYTMLYVNAVVVDSIERIKTYTYVEKDFCIDT